MNIFFFLSTCVHSHIDVVHSYILSSSMRLRNDCECKSFLPPTATTFDVLSSGTTREGASTPHVVTITGSTATDNRLYYRYPVVPNGNVFDGGASTWRAWDLARLEKCHIKLFVYLSSLYLCQHFLVIHLFLNIT